MPDKVPEKDKPLPYERVVSPDLKPIYVTGATGELTPSFGMIHFQLDRPIFRLEGDRSVVDKVRREVLVELHMSYGVWKAIGSFMVEKAKETESRSHGGFVDETELQQKEKWIRDYDTARSGLRAKRILEISSPQVVGKGFPPPLDPDKIPDETKEKYWRLESSMMRIWNEAMMNYAYGFFQSCTFLVGALLELLIEQYLRLKLVWSDYESENRPEKRWLGTLIEYCRKRKIFDEQTLGDASDINDLRVKAVHMEAEKDQASTPPDENPLTEFEDITEVKLEGEQISVGARMLPGESVILDASDPAKLGFRRVSMYKPQARDAFALLSKVFWSIRHATAQNESI